MEYAESTIQQTWEAARALPDADPGIWRQDECGAWIQREHYESPDSPFGWTIRAVGPPDAGKMPPLRAFHRDNDFDIATRRAHCRVTHAPEGRTNRNA